MDEGQRSATAPAYHKIRSLAVTGGFLERVELDFHDAMNCVIGGRGTGKTTVLEALRYALDRMPDPTKDKDRHRAIESLLQSNLGGGSVRVEIETSEGARYTVIRGIGERPLVTTDEGQPIDINIGKDILFGVDIYSQNQIEDIANDAFFQLQLIDKFIHREVEDLRRHIAETTRELQANAAKILEARRLVDDLVEATRELPDVEEKLRGFEKAGEGASSQLRQGHDHKRMRAQEQRLVEDVRALYGAGAEAIDGVVQNLRRGLDDAFEVDLRDTPNRGLVDELRISSQAVSDRVERSLHAARNELTVAQKELIAFASRLADAHGLQEKGYRELLDKQEQERAKGVELTRLVERQADLKAKDNRLEDARAELTRLNATREQLRVQLSDQRDRLFQLRAGVAADLNGHLSPMIRVTVEQFGNADDYRALLNAAMKGSGLRYASIVDRVVERIPPAELASLVQNEDRVALERELDLDADRATRLIIQLKDKPEIFAIEIVELHDRPLLELKDGPDYKDSSSLSTGQKCTTILPILLMESERPLLVDQPEDNLDNAFVFETIVPTVRAVAGRRQLIFVTHNPNIPVLGDAARVFALRSTGRAASIAKAGTVDDVAQEIMTILEGGRAAFEARQKRYGQPVPEGTRTR